MSEATIWICGGGNSGIRRKYLPCFNCKRTTRCVIKYASSIWYDPIVTCVNCGDSWSGGEVMERPFQRGWRKKSITQARQDWASAKPAAVVDAEQRAFVKAEIDAYTALATPGDET